MPFLANEEEEETCMKEEKIFRDVVQMLLYKIIQTTITTIIKSQTLQPHQSLIVGKDHQNNKIRKLAKFMEEQITLPQSATTYMNTLLEMKAPKKHCLQ